MELINQTPLLIVEGEKTCDAARKIVGDAYTVITWSHGTNSVAKTDWSPAFGLPILLWPDADEPGVKAVYQIAEILKNQCPNLKIIGVQGHPEGWDAANAFDEGWNYSKFLEWAKPRAQKYETMAEVVNKESIKIDTSETEVVTKSVYSMWESLGLAMDKNGNPICNMDNVLRIFETSEEFRNVVWYDEFHKKYFTTWHTGVPREWSDVDDLMLTQFFQRELGLSRIGDEHINKAIRVYGTKNKRNEPMDWLNTLKWDGIARVENFFVDCFGAKDNEYHRSASKNWWTSMVARVLSPGIKVDSMIVLEGKQGKFKSTALGVIGGPWYTEAHESVTSKDFFMLFQGKLIIEIAELDAFSRAETNTIKKVITCQVDRYRPPYGRATCDFPRQCIFVGTTNESNYLHDITGARRFWPIKTGIIDVNKIREQREKLFAEAVVLVMHGHKWYEMPVSTEEVQEQRRDTDEWEHIIESYVETHNPGEFGFLISEIAKDCLNITTDKLDKRSQNRIGKILRLLGFENKVVRRGGASVASRSWLKLSRPVDLV